MWLWLSTTNGGGGYIYFLLCARKKYPIIQTLWLYFGDGEGEMNAWRQSNTVSEKLIQQKQALHGERRVGCLKSEVATVQF